MSIFMPIYRRKYFRWPVHRFSS